MSRMANTFMAIWYDGSPVPWWCVPLEGIYRLVIWLRRGAYQYGFLRRRILPVPIIVVGNVTVGGSGKTPLTIALVEALRARGYQPGVVSRGYGGRRRHPCLLDATVDPPEVGDEPCLMRDLGIPVAIGVDRVAASMLLHASGCDVIVADDGLQHDRLARDLEICVMDGVRRAGNARLLPAGPLREPLSRLEQVDFRVCNGGRAHAGEVPMKLELSKVHHLFDGREQSLVAFRGKRVHAVAGIGHPQRFFDSLRDVGLDVMAHPFADHHAFSADDLAFADDTPVLMTTKDAVKCRAFAHPHWWSVEVQAHLPECFFDAVVARIAHAASRAGASGDPANL